ncbi:MAG: hypothetical protein JW818_21805 [Pirellulales bacterium]|nr:hypothetical protein [Pirellulales bacterium]
MSKNSVLELFGSPVAGTPAKQWQTIARKQWCPYLNRKCLKVRKSEPSVSIGACSVQYGSEKKGLLICPHRFLERKQVFTDCLQLLTTHQPGNELHLLPEISVPGGHVDYFLASVKKGKVKDFVGIELQTLDTTGTIWPARQRLLKEKGIAVARKDVASEKSFGINWKMTAKTILVQLHHKIETFEHLRKHLVLVIQDHLLAYMSANFSMKHLEPACLGNPLQIHAYQLEKASHGHCLSLANRFSTNAEGLAACLGLQADPRLELQAIIEQLERKLSSKTLFTVGV